MASFWVAFEVDYARRLGKPIFAYGPSKSVIELDAQPPLTLDVFASYQHADDTAVNAATDYLARERGFDVWLDRERLKAGAVWEEEIRSNLLDRAKRGYVVCFWSRAAQASAWLSKELALAAERRQDASDRIGGQCSNPVSSRPELSTTSRTLLSCLARTDRFPRTG